MAERIYREPSTRRGKHESKMLGMDRPGRAAYKAEVLGRLPRPGVWEERGVRFEITDDPRSERGMLVVSVRARRVSDGLPLPLSNPIRVQNPPLKIPDGTWHKEKGPDGEEVDVENHVEDPEAALRRIVADTAFAVWGREGWLP